MKQISEISNRKRQYIDILDKQVDGQNIYYLVGHSRGNIFHNNTGHYQGKREVQNPLSDEFGQKMLFMPDSAAVRLKTIPNSNLTARKRAVLNIHAENMKMVKKLEDTKAN